MAKRKRKMELREFQKRDVLFMKQNDYRVLVANGQGTGKTIECLAAISIDRKMLCPVIVVCPSSVVFNWHKEARKWCKWARVHVVADRASPLPKRRAHIYITSWSLLVERVAELGAVRPRLLIADEAHFAKNEEAKRSQCLFDLAQLCPHLLLLSGTPLINSLSELTALENLFGTKKPPMIRRLLSDVAPDVPPKTRLVIPVYLRPRHARQYRRAVEEFDEWLKDELAKKMDEGEAEQMAKRSLAAEALVKVGYLRRLVGVAKTYAAVDWISRAVRVGEPVVVFCEHGEVIRRIQKMLKRQNISQVTVQGSTPKKQRQSSVEKFQRGEVAVFIGTKAAHTGITLSRARHLCFVERFWTSADEEQAEDRIRRISQKYPTKIWFLHATGTVDDRIAEIVDRKRRIIANTIGSEVIEDKPETTVLEILSNWSLQTGAKIYEGDPMLGVVKSLPPLPSPKTVQAIIFRGKRWNEASSRAWCKMNKYPVVSMNKTSKGYEVLLHKPAFFRPNSFRVQSISAQITILLGDRRSRPSQTKLRTQRRSRNQKQNLARVLQRKKPKRRRVSALSS